MCHFFGAFIEGIGERVVVIAEATIEGVAMFDKDFDASCVIATDGEGEGVSVFIASGAVVHADVGEVVVKNFWVSIVCGMPRFNTFAGADWETAFHPHFKGFYGGFFCDVTNDGNAITCLIFFKGFIALIKKGLQVFPL